MRILFLIVALILQIFAIDYRTIMRSQIVAPNGEEHLVKDFGNYYAILIYVDKYSYLNDLKTPKKDVEDIAKVLKDKYSFKNIKIVANPKNGDELIKILDDYRVKLTDKDNLLIYYAGHGSIFGNLGYWQLSNAEKNRRVGWISIKEAINTTLNLTKAKHILVVADSCYSGILTREGVQNSNLSQNDKKYYSKLNSFKSRVALTSGALQPVLDKDPNNSNHSVFANAFLKVLKENKSSIFSLEEKFYKIKRYVQLNTENQTPTYGDIRQTGHQDGGDFIFVNISKVNGEGSNKTNNSNIQKIKQKSVTEKNNTKQSIVCENLNNKICLKKGLQYLKNKEYKKAKDIFSKLCKTDNYSRGCYELGKLYYYGKGVKKDKINGRKLFIKACSIGSIRSCRNVGIMYMYGTKPLNKNINKAKKLLKYSCNKKDSVSCRKLGDIYKSNNIKLATKYYKLSCNMKDKKACNLLKQIEQKNISKDVDYYVIYSENDIQKNENLSKNEDLNQNKNETVEVENEPLIEPSEVFNSAIGLLLNSLLF